MRKFIIPSNPELINGKFYNDIEVIAAKYCDPGTPEYYSLLSDLLLFVGLKNKKLEKNLRNNII